MGNVISRNADAAGLLGTTMLLVLAGRHLRSRHVVRGVLLLACWLVVVPVALVVFVVTSVVGLLLRTRRR